uniref:Putative secreted protein n=1 Tax=Ixodes ricinus TaxID=34613 RepID=A0A147BD03_IXORI
MRPSHLVLFLCMCTVWWVLCQSHFGLCVCVQYCGCAEAILESLLVCTVLWMLCRREPVWTLCVCREGVLMFWV